MKRIFVLLLLGLCLGFTQKWHAQIITLDILDNLEFSTGNRSDTCFLLANEMVNTSDGRYFKKSFSFHEENGGWRVTETIISGSSQPERFSEPEIAFLDGDTFWVNEEYLLSSSLRSNDYPLQIFGNLLNFDSEETSRGWYFLEKKESILQLCQLFSGALDEDSFWMYSISTNEKSPITKSILKEWEKLLRENPTWRLELIMPKNASSRNNKVVYASVDRIFNYLNQNGISSYQIRYWPILSNENIEFGLTNLLIIVSAE